MNETILKIGIVGAFEDDGVQAFHKILKDKTEARKTAQAEKGEKFNEAEFECGYIAAKLNVLKHFVNLKEVARNVRHRQEIVEILEEIIEELENVK